MARLVMQHVDGRTEEKSYDGLILPESYIKIMNGDTVECIHESLVPRLVLHEATPDEFESLA